MRLKPCPFCGGEAKLFVDEEGVSLEKLDLVTTPIFYVSCIHCPALTSGFTREEAIANWNRRIKE